MTNNMKTTSMTKPQKYAGVLESLLINCDILSGDAFPIKS